MQVLQCPGQISAATEQPKTPTVDAQLNGSGPDEHVGAKVGPRVVGEGVGVAVGWTLGNGVGSAVGC